MIPSFAGAVLTGGRSRRMGADKALLVVEGRPLATVAAGALRDAGATDVVAVGGDRSGLEAMGLRWAADSGGIGPLDGLAVALDALDAPIVVVLACDLPFVTSAAVVEVVRAIDTVRDIDVAVPIADGRDQVLLAAWRRSTALPAVRAALDTGGRAMRDALARLRVHRFPLSDPGWARNANTPAELPS
jgi:molybdenum cofactor guanylyltransferase